MIQTARARRGTSLIEVLVVLVILVIGILAIARLFPAGFVALRNAENNSFADRLAQGALEQLKQDNGALADGIYMFTDAGTPSIGFNPNVAPDDLFAFVPNGNGYNTSKEFGTLTDLNNNINKQRYISNETITIGGNRDSSSTNFPLHFLTYGPVYLPDTSKLGNYLIVNGLPWAARSGDSRTNPSDSMRAIDDPTDILEPNQATFMVDYGTGQLAVPPTDYPQTFNVLVQTASGPSQFTLVTHPQNGSVPYKGEWFNAATTNSGTVDNSNLMPAGPWLSVNIYRPFHYLGLTPPPATPAFTNDPYEFALYTPNIGPTANMGVLAFNQLAAGRGTGTQPLKARVSYSVLDWHILHEDHDVAAGDADGGPTVRLRLSHLKKVGDIQFDDSIYGGLLNSQAPDQYDVLMLNLDTGGLTKINGATGAGVEPDGTTKGAVDLDTVDASDPSKYNVSYQNGRVTFPASNARQRLRFYYSGDADWAVAVQKAPSYYTLANPANPSDTTLLTKPSAQRQPTDPQTPNLYAISSADRVYFPLCDAGKTVEFDGITYTAGSTTRQIGQGTATISTDTVDLGGDRRAVYANLTGAGLNSSGVITDAQAISALRFGAVRGVSARAIVIWRERNKWRSRSLDTLLTQTP